MSRRFEFHLPEHDCRLRWGGGVVYERYLLTASTEVDCYTLTADSQTRLPSM